MVDRRLSRREALVRGAVPVVAGALASRSVQGAQVPASSRAGLPQLALVSRHVQWTDVAEGAAVAAEAGFKAIAWTCRPGAHILPENVARDLPRAVETARQAGLDTPMLITAINTVDAPHAERILDTMRQAGITRYRAPNFRYDYAKDLPAQWEALKPTLAALARLNEKYGTTAMFHTHSAQGSVGGGVWDLWLLVKDYPADVLSINYDIGHATVRGGIEWMQTARFAHRHIRALSLKDMHWVKNPAAAPGTYPWRHEFVYPGQGMVNFRDMFAYFQSVQFAGPCETYFEYTVDLGNGRSMNMLGTDRGSWQLEMPKAAFVNLMKRDVTFYRTLFASIGWNVG